MRYVPLENLFGFAQIRVMELLFDVWTCVFMTMIPVSFLACFTAVADKFAALTIIHVVVHGRSVLCWELMSELFIRSAASCQLASHELTTRRRAN